MSMEQYPFPRHLSEDLEYVQEEIGDDCVSEILDLHHTWHVESVYVTETEDEQYVVEAETQKALIEVWGPDNQSNPVGDFPIQYK